jgi:hypothetical protein
MHGLANLPLSRGVWGDEEHVLVRRQLVGIQPQLGGEREAALRAGVPLQIEQDLLIGQEQAPQPSGARLPRTSW